jgi:hypothetical protein
MAWAMAINAAFFVSVEASAKDFAARLAFSPILERVAFISDLPPA